MRFCISIVAAPTLYILETAKRSFNIFYDATVIFMIPVVVKVDIVTMTRSLFTSNVNSICIQAVVYSVYQVFTLYT